MVDFIRITQDGDTRITQDGDARITEEGIAPPYTPWGPQQVFVAAGGDQAFPASGARQRFVQTIGFQEFDTDPPED